MEASMDLLFLEEENRTERAQALFHLGIATTTLTAVALMYLLNGVDFFPSVVILEYITVAMSFLLVVSIGVLWLKRRGRYHPAVKYATLFMDLLLVFSVGILASIQSPHMIGTYLPGLKTPAWFLLLLLSVTPAFRYSVDLAILSGVGGQLVILGWMLHGQLYGGMEWTYNLADDIFGQKISLLGTATRAGLTAALSIAVWLICRNSRRVVTSAVETQVGLAHEQFRRRQMQDTVKRYFPPQLADTMAEGGIPGLGGERRRLVIIISDIRNFTTAAEAMDPAQVVGELNRYFTEMVEILFRTGGTLLGFMGDGLIAVYGLPQAAEDDAHRAVGAAREMLVHLRRLKEQGAFPGLGDFRIGIGVHMGDVMVGNVGSPQRMEYTVIGDAVNTAARVESLTKELHTQFLITADVLESLDQTAADFIPRGEYHVKGKSHLVQVYSLAEEATA